ncbi:MAG TPA: phenylalanine--tRNA ligase beta subunit-related protein [Thermoanaerobaculia bacterium]|nr:phenylalanine--tRNA ligase beta subunit-related protein [Thermoanaerobaculia bacterium]
MRFSVDPAVFEILPRLRIAAILARGLDNASPRPDLEQRLLEAATAAASDFVEADFPSHPAIVPWRQAYQAFGAKPSKFRSSIESLLRSAAASRIRGINPLVDIYNAVSLRHRLPCGGEDLAAIEGDFGLFRAVGGEPFVPLGGVENEPALPGELIYRDDLGAVCRCLNWREAERTKLTATTRGAILVIEALGESDEALMAAARDLAATVHLELGGEARLGLLSCDRAAVDLSAAA